LMIETNERQKVFKKSCCVCRKLTMMNKRALKATVMDADDEASKPDAFSTERA
jgi:hypothetical protein